MQRFSVSQDHRESCCANELWHGSLDPETGEWKKGFRQRLEELVGWKREPHPILGTREAYEVAYQTLYRALPDCRNCPCEAMM